MESPMSNGRTEIRREISDTLRTMFLRTTVAVLATIALSAGVGARRAHAVGTYSFDAATATPAGWAQSWTSQLASTSGWTGADGLYSIPMNGNRKLGSAYDTPGWQTFTFNDSLIGTVDASDRRTGFRFINNSIGMYSGMGAAPTPISFKWKGDQLPPFDSAASMITGPDAGGLYWPLDGIVVPRTGGGEQYVQFAMKIEGGLTATAVSQMTWPVPDGVNYSTNWPYNGNRGDTWSSSIDSVGPLPNLYKADPDGSGPTGELVMGTAILDTSSAAKAYTANGYAYIYGTRNDFLSKKVFVARAVPEDVSNPSAWAFWNAASSAWVTGASAINSATPMRDTSNAALGDMAVEYSVTQLPDGRFAMVYLNADALGTQISARYASAPQGPWSARQLLYNVSIPNSGNSALGLPDISAYSDWMYVIYGAKAHAQLSKAPSGLGTENAGKLLISFNVNTWKTNGSTSQPDPGWVYGSIYRPRFISVDIVGVPVPVPGDYNQNGIVDAADYTVWRDHLGQTYSLPNRSSLLSGPVSTADYTYWKSQFGQHAGSGAASAVPEPASLLLMGLGCSIVALIGRRSHLCRRQLRWPVLVLRHRSDLHLFRCVPAIAVIAIAAANATAAEPLVGAYYYPWYGTFPGGHSWTDTLRAKLVPAQPPALGYYNSRSSTTIASQIDESHRGNISFWATSWWGPGSAEDTTTRNYIFANPRAGELKYAVHYESTGRLGDSGNPNFTNFVPDFQYLGQNYFNNANYLKIDGRPVVFIYLTRAYFNTQAGRDAVANLRQTMTSQFGVNPYLVGDDVFPGQTNATRAGLWDAITDFDVYGSALQANGSTTAGVTALANQYQDAKQVAQTAHVGFVPAVSPGFNDSAVRSGHPAAPRYLTDVAGAAEGSLFSAELSQAALPNLDPAASNMLMVSTFNEWHEDTQIEPTVVANPTSADSSGHGTYTQGYSYAGYGNLYLDRLHSATLLTGDYDGNGTVGVEDYNLWKNNFGSTTNLAADGNGNGIVDAADYTIWRDTLGQSVSASSGADGNGNGMIDSGDYDVWKTHFGNMSAGNAAGSSAGAAIPEANAWFLLLTGGCLLICRRNL
jgi:glycoprotein endo-alpha-1,2-mannosidase